MTTMAGGPNETPPLWNCEGQSKRSAKTISREASACQSTSAARETKRSFTRWNSAMSSLSRNIPKMPRASSTMPGLKNVVEDLGGVLIDEAAFGIVAAGDTQEDIVGH